MSRDDTQDKSLSIASTIIELLAENGCTVQEANHILTMAYSAIRGTTKVQYTEELSHEF